MTRSDERCAYMRKSGVCGLDREDLLHAMPGTEAYNELTERQRAILIEEIGGIHAFESPHSATVVESPHRYLSTYCYHGQHANCRLTCKVCASPCVCECHAKGEGESR